jgi:hypothetical protein
LAKLKETVYNKAIYGAFLIKYIWGILFMEKLFTIKLFALGLLASVLLSGVALSASAEFGQKRAALASNGFVPDEECYQLPKSEWELRSELAGACRAFWLGHVEHLLNAGVSPERMSTKEPELELALCSTKPESVALVELLVRKGANVESLGSILGNKTLFQIALVPCVINFDGLRPQIA